MYTPLTTLSLASSLALLSLSSLPSTAASPTPLTSNQATKPIEPLRVPIKRRNGGKNKRDVESFKKQAANMRGKYGAKTNYVSSSNSTSTNEKRAGTVSMTSYQDS